MKYAIQVTGSPNSGNGGLSALRFVEAALLSGHQIIRVFFYKEGVYQAFRYATPADDELHLAVMWSDLAQRHALDLVVCVSAAQKRGLLSSEEARRQGKQDNDIATGFRIGGLGQWVEAAVSADRFIEFP